MSSGKRLRISVICPAEQVVEDLGQMLSGRDDVALRHAFLRDPGQVELDRHLHFYSPQALLVSNDGDSDVLELVAHVRNTYPSLPVVLLHSAAHLGPESLLPFMRAGIREVIFQPLDPQDIADVVDRLCAMPAKDAIPSLGRVLCFLPSKPGVGASTVAINTAAALAREGSRVLLVDADLTSGMVRFMLKLKNPSSIRDAAQRIAELDENLWPQMVTKVREGLDVLHAGKVSPTASLDSEVLLRLMDFWRTIYDVVCFDFSGNLEQFSLHVMRFADRIFLISTSEVTALHLLLEKTQILKTHDLIERVLVVHNRKASYEDLSTRQIEGLIGMPVCKVIRNCYSETLEANREGRAVSANSVLGAEFTSFAAELCGKPPKSRNTLGQALMDFVKKSGVLQTRQIVGPARAGVKGLVTYQPVLAALPEPEPKALVRYKSSTRLAEGRA